MNKLNLKNIIESVFVLTAICMCLVFSACENSAQTENSPDFAGQPTVAVGVYGEESVAPVSDKYSEYDLNATWDESASVIKLNGDTVDVAGKGAVADGSTVTIGQEGTYVFSGTLNDGQIIVSVEKIEKVHIVLNGVNVTCSDSSVLYVKSADKVCVTVVKDTVNTFADGKTYSYASGEAEHNSCIYSKDDLTFNGTGTFNVYGNYNNGIATTNDLKIVSGNINVTAVNNGIKGKDSIAINSGNINVTSQDDGLKVENEAETQKGYLCIEGGSVTVTAGDDALQSIQSVTISGGNVNVIAGGQAVNCVGNVDIKDGCLIENNG